MDTKYLKSERILSNKRISGGIEILISKYATELC
jgi:hypothetical protein